MILLVHFVLIIVMLAFCSGLSVFGTMLAAQLLSVRLTRVDIGVGRRIAAFTIGPMDVNVRLIPIGTGFSWRGRAEGWRRGVMVTAGSWAVAILFAALVVLHLISGVRLVERSGVLIHIVEPGAAAAALRPGDVIVGVGDQSVHDRVEFGAALAHWQPGIRRITVVRDGRRLEFDVIRPSTEAGSPGRIGIGYGGVTRTMSLTPWEAVRSAPQFGARFILHGVFLAGFPGSTLVTLPDGTSPTGRRAFLVLTMVAASFLVLALIPIPGLPGWDAGLSTIAGLFGHRSWEPWRDRLNTIEKWVGYSLVVAACIAFVAAQLPWLPQKLAEPLRKGVAHVTVPTIDWLR
jgi:hypothetical protein